MQNLIQNIERRHVICVVAGVVLVALLWLGNSGDDNPPVKEATTPLPVIIDGIKVDRIEGLTIEGVRIESANGKTTLTISDSVGAAITFDSGVRIESANGELKVSRTEPAEE